MEDFCWRRVEETIKPSRGIIGSVIAFYLPGGMAVYVFPILLGLGATIGLLWVGLQSPARVALQSVNAGLVGLLGSLVGGRVTFVAAHWSYFQLHWGEIPQIYLGGLSWPGALAGGVLAVALYARMVNQRLAVLLDTLLPLLGMVLVSVWLACWLDGYAYGEASQAWWALPARDEWGVLTRRVPVQLLGALLALLTVWLFDRLRVRSPLTGQAALLVLTLLCLQLFGLSFLRADPAPLWRGLHPESWSALALALFFFLVFLVYAAWDRQHRARIDTQVG